MENPPGGLGGDTSWKDVIVFGEYHFDAIFRHQYTPFCSLKHHMNLFVTCSDRSQSWGEIGKPDSLNQAMMQGAFQLLEQLQNGTEPVVEKPWLI